MKLCKTPGCCRQAYRAKSGSFAYCNPCRAEREKARDLVAWAYRKLKSNAKGRGCFFDLTLDEFRAFCYETQILLGRGRTAQSYHVDRIIDADGYTAGNLQKLTNTENLAKEMLRRKSVAWVSRWDKYGEPERGGVLRVLDYGPPTDDSAFPQPPF
ncbi:hypothetical protein Q5H92_26405 [Hymenobacter sp. M29]|uniref:Uncharacterized protein n=1 Tax=Hymenobacter mellowenesis TaxID=3063995 RepID=A0ABT9AKC6_9BACT|nr:hypothetical protein [Hymenobacter sp. M29]MDO7849919.1 hypothetical protein [Hymenobacter sp. M29]